MPASLIKLGLCLILANIAGSLKLHHDIYPIHYDILLVPKECEFSGKVAIDIEVKNATDEFLLHSKQLQVDPSNVKLKRIENGIDISDKDNKDDYYFAEGAKKNLTLEDVKDGLKVTLSEPLEVGSKYRLYMGFKGTMNSRRRTGIYCQRFRYGNTTQWLVSASFEPNNARTAFPCFDEPRYKANFTVSIARLKSKTALSNMPLKTTKPFEESDWVLDTFQTTPKMSTYLVSFLVSDYKSLSSKLSNGKPIKIWAGNGREQYGDLPLRMASRHMDYFQNYTSFEDPMPKQDFIAVVNFMAGGLENWGIISYEEKNLLFNPRYRRNKQVVLRCCNLIAHELAHSWFGNLVTPSKWRDIWLSEGFATYYAAISTNKVYPVWNYDTQAWVMSRENAMGRDCLPTTHPLRLTDDSEMSVKDLFDEITYYKGASIVRMLNFTLGEKVLQEGIRCYINERQYSSASHKALWSCLEKSSTSAGIELPSGLTLEEVMDSWINKPGYPVVTVERDYDTGEITISQKSVHEKEVIGREQNYESGWWIPITYTYQDNNETSTEVKFWLDPNETNTTISDPATSEQVRYDQDNAALLLNDISDIWLDDRIQVVADMVELARLGLAPITGSLEALAWLKNELSPFPWLALLGSASKTFSLFKNTELESLYTDFLNDILAVGMNKLEEDSPHRKELVTLSCKIGVEQCSQMGRQIFKKWAESPSNEIPEDIRYAIYCLGVTEGDTKTWELISNRILKTDDIKDRKDMLKALACTKNETTLHKYLDWAFESNKTSVVRKTSVILKALAKRDPDLLLNTLATKKGYQLKKSCKRSMKWQRLLESIAVEINNPRQVEKLRDIVKANTETFKSAVSTSAVISIAESNIDWLNNNRLDAMQWLNKNRKSRKTWESSVSVVNY